MKRKGKNELGGRLFVPLTANLIFNMLLLAIAALASALVVVSFIQELFAVGAIFAVAALIAVVTFWCNISKLLKSADFADFLLACLLLKNGGASEADMEEMLNKSKEKKE